MSILKILNELITNLKLFAANLKIYKLYKNLWISQCTLFAAIQFILNYFTLNENDIVISQQLYFHVGSDWNLKLLFILLLFVIRQQQYFALGSGQTIMLKTSLLNSGDDAFLPRLTLRFPNNIHYIKVLQSVSLRHADWAAWGHVWLTILKL